MNMHLSRDLEVSERYTFYDFPKYNTKIIATPVKHLLTKISMLNFVLQCAETLKLLNGFIASIIVMQTQKKHLLLTSILNIYLGSNFVLRSNCVIRLFRFFTDGYIIQNKSAGFECVTYTFVTIFCTQLD